MLGVPDVVTLEEAPWGQSICELSRSRSSEDACHADTRCESIDPTRTARLWLQPIRCASASATGAPPDAR